MFNLPEILTIVIGALLALVFIDGIRRAIRIRRSSLKVDLMDVDEYVSKDFEEEWMQGFSDEPLKEEFEITEEETSLDIKPSPSTPLDRVLPASTAPVSVTATTSLSDPLIVIVRVAVSVPPLPSEIV